MGDKDSKLIFEAYQNVLIVENEEESSWGDTAIDIFKIIDPTGISNWMDLYRAGHILANDLNRENVMLFLLAIFNALPNLGVLAAGVGGIGWVALKSFVKGASRNPMLLEKLWIDVFNLISKSQLLKNTMIKSVETAVDKKVVDSSMGRMLVQTIVDNGKLPAELTQKTIRTGAKKAKGSLTASAEKAQDEFLSATEKGGMSELKKGVRKSLIPLTPKTATRIYAGNQIPQRTAQSESDRILSGE